MYSSDLITFAIDEDKKSEGMRYWIRITPNDKIYTGSEFRVFLSLCSIFTTCIQNLQIDNVVLEDNKWYFYGKFLDYSKNTTILLRKIYRIIICIFESLKSELAENEDRVK